MQADAELDLAATALGLRDGAVLEANFGFALPMLPNGDYSMTVAIADGDLEDHVQHHWIQDALHFKSESTNVATGLLGIPMRRIALHAGGHNDSIPTP